MSRANATCASLFLPIVVFNFLATHRIGLNRVAIGLVIGVVIDVVLVSMVLSINSSVYRGRFDEQLTFATARAAETSGKDAYGYYKNASRILHQEAPSSLRRDPELRKRLDEIKPSIRKALRIQLSRESLQLCQLAEQQNWRRFLQQHKLVTAIAQMLDSMGVSSWKALGGAMARLAELGREAVRVKISFAKTTSLHRSRESSLREVLGIWLNRLGYEVAYPEGDKPYSWMFLVHYDEKEIGVYTSNRGRAYEISCRLSLGPAHAPTEVIWSSDEMHETDPFQIIEGFTGRIEAKGDGPELSFPNYVSTPRAFDKISQRIKSHRPPSKSAVFYKSRYLENVARIRILAENN